MRSTSFPWPTCVGRLLLLLGVSGASLFTAQAQTGGVGIGTTAPDASAALDIVASAKGALLPRLTALGRGNISSPATGLIIFQTDGIAGFYYNAGTPAAPVWQQLATAAGTATGFVQNQNAVDQAANFRINGNGSALGNFGIGTSTPGAKLHIAGTVKIDAANTLEFGAGVAGKEANAGKIGYGSFSAGASLDVVGAGTTNANRKIQFFNEGGASFNGNVGIGTPSPTAKLDVVGDVQVPAANAYKYAAAKAYTLHLSAADFQPQTSATTKLIGPYNTFYPGATNGVFQAPLHLPQGTSITSIDLFLGDNDANNSLTVKLQTMPFYSAITATLVTYTSVDNGSSYQAINVPVSGVVIDNSANNYYLQVSMTNSNIVVALGNVRMNYTVTQTE